MNKKVALLFLYHDKMDVTFEEIGICLIASYLRENGILVKLIAQDIQQFEDAELLNFEPDMVGFVVYQQNKSLIQRYCQKLKTKLPNVHLCAGGVYASTNTVDFLEETPELDFCVYGEGEETLYEIICALDNQEQYKHIQGMAYRSNKKNEIIKNSPRHLTKNVDAYPFAARDFLKQQKLGIVRIVGSRGCCAHCSYCTSKVVYPHWRYRSIENIVNEMEVLVRDYGVKTFNFTDNSIEDADKNATRIKELADSILCRKLNIKYNVYARADIYKKITADEMRRLIDSGLWSMDIGVETANEADLNLYGKSSELSDNIEVLRFLQPLPIQKYINFINFNPYSTFEGLRKNADYLYEYGDIMHYFSKLLIYKGTSVYKTVYSDGLFLYKDAQGNNQYSFKDDRIQKLYGFMNAYRMRSSSHLNGLLALEKYLRVLPLQIQFLKQYVPLDETVTLDGLFAQYKQIKKEADNVFYHWYLLLLDNYKTAAGISGFKIVKQTQLDKKIEYYLERFKTMTKMLYKIVITHHIEVVI